MTAAPMTPDEMETAYVSPETGSIKRRALRRVLNGIKAIGPSGPPTPPSPPTKAELADKARQAKKLADDHHEAVEAEIAAVDEHSRAVAGRVEALESTSSSTSSYSLQEWKAEARQLRELRRMLEADLAAGPILHDRYGRALGDRDRAFIRYRARELADTKWSAAVRADREGDRRRARQLRLDALRARQIAEFERDFRPSLVGYGIAPWT